MLSREKEREKESTIGSKQDHLGRALCECIVQGVRGLNGSFLYKIIFFQVVKTGENPRNSSNQLTGCSEKKNFSVFQMFF